MVATVTVTFTPLPAHVRTARFVAASVARRAGVAETLLDEVRLAVSEACSLAVRLHRSRGVVLPVELRLTDDVGKFRVEVVDAVPRPRPADGPLAFDPPDDLPDASPAAGELRTVLTGDALSADDDGPIDLGARERIGLAVIVGLVDDVRVEYLDTGSVITMCWPITSGATVGSPIGSLNVF
jgi:anti-sigma regulatory factor (Ser/Thr protein kinase)